MSRHTLNDGITPDPGITPASFDYWWRELAPPAWLIGSYYKRGLSWDDFALAYVEHLKTDEVSKKVKELIRLAISQDVAVMCIEDTPENCHRRLLAEHCQIMEPSLLVEIS